MQMRARDDGVHQVAFIFHQPQSALEVRLSRMRVKGLLKNIDTLFQVGFDLNLPVDARNIR